MVPKTVTDNGSTLTLSNVQWSSEAQADGSAHYTASATYAGTATSRYATGYTVTANYTGQIAKTGCEIVTYTAIFAGTKMEPEAIPEEKTEPEPEKALAPVPDDEPTPPPDVPEPEAGSDGKLFIAFGIAGCLGYLIALGAVGYVFIQKKKKQEAISI